MHCCITGGDRRGSTDEAAGPPDDVTSNGDPGQKDASSNGVDGRPKNATGGSAELTGANGSASPDEVMASAGLSVATGREGERACSFQREYWYKVAEQLGVNGGGAWPCH